MANLIIDADFALANFNLTNVAGNARTCEEYLKNALDAANNNKNFVQAGPGSCPFTTPY